MTFGETVVGGFIITIFGTMAGLLIGGRNKVSKEDCRERQAACTTHICSEISHVATSQKEMKSDIKDILKIIRK